MNVDHSYLQIDKVSQLDGTDLDIDDGLRAVTLFHDISENAVDVETQCECLLNQSTAQVLKGLDSSQLKRDIGLIHVFILDSVSSNIETRIRRSLKKCQPSIGSVHQTGILHQVIIKT